MHDRRIAFPSGIHLAGLGLILREWGDQDVPTMVELFDEPQVDRWTPLRSPFDPAAARAYLDQARRSRASDQRIQLAITTDGRRPMGEILLFRTGTSGEAELAYAVGAAHRRQRLTFRAMQLMTRYAYESLAMNRLLLRIAAGNAASAALARACDFHRTDSPSITREGAQDALLTWQHRRPPTPSQ
jgi:RimJ/RimL family protein N-acetyltransferase